jgi:hypothetical protein
MDARCDYQAEVIQTRDSRTSFVFCWNEAVRKEVGAVITEPRRHKILTTIARCKNKGRKEGMQKRSERQEPRRGASALEGRHRPKAKCPGGVEY